MGVPMPAQDFDFEHGAWRVRHRRLATRLKGANDWQEFDGTADVRPILGGAGNVEDNLIRYPGGAYRAIALRSYDAETGLWAIWWLDQRAPHGLDVPVVGRFDNGVGIFDADDTQEGRPVRLRFRWDVAGQGGPRWSQALSEDEGQTWEVNWEMQFTAV
jgi:hypothetical protein